MAKVPFLLMEGRTPNITSPTPRPPEALEQEAFQEAFSPGS